MGKRFYWLKLPTNFRQRQEIKRLYRKYPEHADTIAMTYIDILAAVANTDGVFSVGSGADSLTEEIALAIDRDEADVDATCDYLQGVGCMVILEENRRADFPYLREIVGSRTDSAVRMERHRENKKEASQSDDEASQSDTEKEKEEEREVETEEEGETKTETKESNAEGVSMQSMLTSARSAPHAREPCGAPIPAATDRGDESDGEPYESQLDLYDRLTRGRNDIPAAVDGALRKWFVDKEERGQPYKLGPMKGMVNSAVRHAKMYGDEYVAEFIENCTANGYNRLDFKLL